MQPGIARYEYQDKETGKMGEEFLFIDADAMKQSAPSMVGKPVYVHHQKVDLANIQNADGFVSDCFYNELDGWLWAKCLAVSDDAQSALLNKWSVSNAYVPIDWSEGGQHLNIDYNRKIRNYEFTHLAIVPNPRYEEAKIFTPEEFKAYQADKRSELEELQNSKPIPERALMFFRSKKEEIKAGETILDTDFTEIKNDDGTVEIVTVGALKEAKRLEVLNAKKNEKPLDDDEKDVDVDGEMVNMGDLKSCYKNMKSEKKNADEAADKKKKEDDKADEEKKNAEAAEEKEKKDKEEKENALKEKNLRELQNAHLKKPAPSGTDTQMDKEKRGQNRYGSAKK